MITEFIGLPGSGKTTLLKKKQKKNQGKFITRKDLTSQRTPLILRLRFLWRNPGLHYLFLLGFILNADVKLKRWYALWKGIDQTFRQYAQIQYLHNQSQDIKILLDEGLLQRSISVYCFNNRKWNAYLLHKQIEYIKNKQWVNEVIYIKIDIDTSMERCEKRRDGFPYRYRNISRNLIKEKFALNLKGFQIIQDVFDKELITYGE